MQNDQEGIDTSEWTFEYFLLINSSRIINIIKHIDDQNCVIFTDDGKVFLIKLGNLVEEQLETTMQDAKGFEIESIRQIGTIRDKALYLTAVASVVGQSVLE